MCSSVVLAKSRQWRRCLLAEGEVLPKGHAAVLLDLLACKGYSLLVNFRALNSLQTHPLNKGT